MKIKEIHLKKFKRFTDLIITGIPETAKLVVLVGPNGCGKTSVFEGFNHWYKLNGFGNVGDEEYCIKKDDENINEHQNWYNDKVEISAYNTGLITKNDIKGHFYFRTAFRNDPDFTADRLSRQSNPINQVRYKTLMLTDSTVSENYQRLVSHTLSELYNENNNEKTTFELRNELIGKINVSLKNIFEDLELTSIGEPLVNGSFFFTKGTSKNFHYKNLSAGEKAAFDLILDLIVKSEYYNNTVFCIDEPEAHMHTSLQAKLLNELYDLISDNSQLWIATHSIGMLEKARELDEAYPNTVCFIDFSDVDFDSPNVLCPTKITKTIWDKFIDLAFGEFSNLVAPREIVFCEGSLFGRGRKNFDAKIYNHIFSSRHPDTSFVCAGSCTELVDPNNVSMKIIREVLGGSKMTVLIDRDDLSNDEVNEWNRKGIIVLRRRHIECYLLDDEIIEKLCVENSKEDKIQECLICKQEKISNSVSRGKPSDDIKSASGEIYLGLKQILGLTQCGNNSDAFLRDTMAKLITEETQVYKELEREIFQTII